MTITNYIKERIEEFEKQKIECLKKFTFLWERHPFYKEMNIRIWELQAVLSKIEELEKKECKEQGKVTYQCGDSIMHYHPPRAK